MAATINASNSSGIVTTADNSAILQLQTGSTAALTIDTSQNVGIGTASPLGKFEVRSGRSSFQANNEPFSVYVSYASGTNGWFLGGTSTSALAFSDAGGNEKMRIDSSGNVGIGTTPVGSGYRLTSALSGASTQGIGLSVFNVTDGFSAGVINVVKFGSTATPYGPYAVNNVGINTAYTNFNIGTETSHPIVLYTNNTERMRIDSSGNVLIGLTSGPGNRLYVNGGSLTVGSAPTYAIGLANSGGGTDDITLGSDGTYSYIQTWNGKTLFLNNQGNNVSVGGNMGAGVTAPLYKLSVNASSGSSALQLANNGSADTGGYLNGTGDNELMMSGGANYNSYSAPNFVMNAKSTAAGGIYILGATIRFWTNSGLTAGTTFNQTERMRLSAAGGLSVGTTADPGAGAIYATGNITAFYTSDIKLKENVKDVDNALDKVCAIGAKTFDWKDEVIEARGGEDGYFVKKSDFGVIAQDVQAVFPQAVRTRDDGTLAVDYEKLATLAFGAIKELAARVAALENK